MYTLTIYALEDTRLDFNHYVEIDRLTFEAEQDAMDYADSHGYLDRHDYSVSIEDDHGTVTYL